MNPTRPALLALLLLAPLAATAAADFDADLQRASAKMPAVWPTCAEKMQAGDVSGANQTLLAAFPKATRTPAESFLLGNVLYEIDPALSYALHKAAADALPAEPAVAWEWAMEQHRAGEYAGAVKSYRQFSQSRPASASPYALQADCLLHLNRYPEAVAAWQQSERAPNGQVEQMENLVCAVNRDPVPYQRRADLLQKATGQKDADAAADLIALDCDFPIDWWNAGPQAEFLAHDLPAVTAALNLPADDLRSRAMAAAAACATADQEGPAAVAAVLGKYRLLTDADHTLPAHGGLLSVLLRAAVVSKALDEKTLREALAPKLLAAARAGGDVEIWNVAAFAATGTDAEMLALEREGWKATGDARFAAAALAMKQKDGALPDNDPDLAAAAKQFPDSAAVQRFRYEAAARQGKVTARLLADAARAEFSHFSSFVAFATVVDRPRSDRLRAYFKQLATMAPAL